MENRSKSSRDPFLATGEYALDNYVLKTFIDDNVANDQDTKMVDSLLPWEDLANHGRQHFESICGPRQDNIAKAWLAGFKERVLFAALGAAFLIGPMWLMVLQSWLYTTLIATTAFVAAFGLIMAYYLDEGKDVLASTAAYAAVLVVFVGTSTSNTTESAS
ncbi:hypothetical protein GE09DRAFT_1064721 [Coniochaeta sp. 2T2.1]|nr:hypothetical protein GE09DRAFT_1064721 [Coniochaeta sp. 2T2.1]